MFDDLFADYPDIQTIEEFNYRDIVDLPDGYEGVEIGDTIYKFVNRTSIDIYSESKRPVKEAGKYPMWWIRFCDSRNKLGQAAEDMQQAYFESGNNKWNEYYHKMSSLWGQLSGVQYKESTKRCSKMKFKKIVKEAEEGGSDHPRIYVGTYAKYNDGSIDGKWIDISEYNTYEEFVDACRELHADEEDPEFMVQDYENFPEKWYHEGGLPTEEEFNKINDFYLMDDNLKRPFEVYVDYTGNDSIEDFEEAYEGQFDSPEDFGYYCVENFGIPDSAENYIDYEAYGRDLTEYWHQGDEDETDAEGEPEDPEYYYDNDGYKVMSYDSDREVGEQYIDDMGGVEQMGRDELARYFDYDGWGRDLLVNDYWEDEGYVFRNI